MRCEFDALLMLKANQSKKVESRPTGAWLIAAGQALSLRPSQRACLRVARGRAWVTLTGDPIDHMLDAEKQISVRAGQTLVAEGLKGDLWIEWVPCVTRPSPC